jgi:hypothetical protein
MNPDFFSSRKESRLNLLLHLAPSYIFHALVATKEMCVENIKGSGYFCFSSQSLDVLLASSLKQCRTQHGYCEVVRRIFHTLDAGGCVASPKSLQFGNARQLKLFSLLFLLNSIEIVKSGWF